MPISDESATLVAAHLTSAWMQCIHVNALPNSEAELLDVHQRFKDQLEQEGQGAGRRHDPAGNDD